MAIKRPLLVSALILLSTNAFSAVPVQDKLELDFRVLPMSARRLTGPLFWLHGDESKQRLELELDKVALGGNGCFTAESRRHNDWLGKGWYRDLDICLQKAKKLNLKMWIFDEKIWPSQGVGGKVPEKYSAKRLDAQSVDVAGPKLYQSDGYTGDRYIATIAGQLDSNGDVLGDTLIDLKCSISRGLLSWQVPAGKWKIMKFSYVLAPRFMYGSPSYSVDGASKNCVDWYIHTVYQPYYDHFGEDFGRTILGFFYDEPETPGDWGINLDVTLKDWGVDWKKAYAAYKFKLAGDDGAAAKYQYIDAFAETWGRIMYGGIAKWCREHDVLSMGHFMEHGYLYSDPNFCAGDMIRLQKFSDIGALDIIGNQLMPGERVRDIYQTPKLASSISHVYGKTDDLTMCECYGAAGQEITYPQMKWICDELQVRGANFMIPHSFNPRAPYDNDCPPYFYNGGFEPRFPLYRVYADYTSRLSTMLAGGKHICPIAILFAGASKQVGKMVTPEDITTCVQDALYDCDWLPYSVLESNAKISGKDLLLNNESYRVLVVPPVEVIPYATLVKVKEYLENGGIVLGCGYLPSKSATIGKTTDDIAALVKDIWGDAKPGLCKTTGTGGRSYMLSEKPTPGELKQVLADDAKVRPIIEVVKGDTNNWLHVLRRYKDGRDIFFVCNQNWNDRPRQFTLRINALGYPEVWDPMRNEITGVPYKRNGSLLDLDLTLNPTESVMIVMNLQRRQLPMRLDSLKPQKTVSITGSVTPMVASRPPVEAPPPLEGCKWIWSSTDASPGKRYFRGFLNIPDGRKVKSAQFILTCDNEFSLFVNGKPAGRSEGCEAWRNPVKADIGKLLLAGNNSFAIEAKNLGDGPNAAGLIGKCFVELDNGDKIDYRIDKRWKTSSKEIANWQASDYDDVLWAQPVEVAQFGDSPWGMLGQSGRLTESPVQDSTFKGAFSIPADLDLNSCRVCLEADNIAPEAAASVILNGKYAGGFICGPYRLEVTDYLKSGTNTITIAPFSPEGLRLGVYPK